MSIPVFFCIISFCARAQRGKISVSAYHTLLNYKYEMASPHNMSFFQIEKAHTHTTGGEVNVALNRLLTISTGLEYTQLSMKGTEFSFSSYAMPGSSYAMPGTYEANMKILSLPLNLRAYFLKYLFAEFGALFNINYGGDVYVKDGMETRYRYGIGGKYDINPRLSVFALPYRQTTLQIYPKEPDPLFDGLNLGIKYTFGTGSRRK